MNIRRLFIILSGRIGWIIATFAATVALVTVITLLMKPTYKTTSTIRIATAAGSTSSSDYMYADRIMNTYVRIANSSPILTELQQELNLKEDELPEISVTIITSTELIQIAVESNDPVLTMNTANTLANILITKSEELYYGNGQRTLEILQSQLTTIETELAQKRAEYDQLVAQTPPNTAAIESSRLSISLAENTYSNLLDQYEQMRLRETVRSNMVSLVEPAALPLEPSSPKTLLNILLACVVGLIGGIGLAIFVENVDAVLYTEKQAEESTGLTSIANIPKANLKNGLLLSLATGGVFLDGRAAMDVMNSFRTLKTNITNINCETPVKTIMITSARMGEGKTMIVSNLAIVLAQSGQNVILIDADLRKPQVMKRFGLQNNIGLSTILSNRTSAQDAIQTTTIPHLKVITSGPLPTNPIGLLESEEMTALLAELKQEYDFVLVDAPALLPVADALLLVPQMDAVSLVVRGSVSRTDAVKDAKRKLERLGANMIGVIVNSEKRIYRYSYYY